MNTVIERLRALKLAHAGYNDGVYWATHTAKYTELRRLSELNDDGFFARAAAPYSSSGYLAFILGIDIEKTDRDRNYELSQRLGGKFEELDGGDYSTGFCEGALSVFQEVEEAPVVFKR
jgi:hypothetical protein